MPSFVTVTLDAAISWSLRESATLEPPFDTTEDFAISGTVVATRETCPPEGTNLGANQFAFGVNECFCPDCGQVVGNPDDPDGDTQQIASIPVTGTDTITPDGGSPVVYAVSGTLKLTFGYALLANPNPPFYFVDFTRAAYSAKMELFIDHDGILEPQPIIEWSSVIDLVSCRTWSGAGGVAPVVLDLWRNPSGNPIGPGYGPAFLDLPGTHPSGWLMQSNAATFTWTIS